VGPGRVRLPNTLVAFLKANFPRLLKYIYATVYATVLIAKVYAEKRNNTQIQCAKKQFLIALIAEIIISNLALIAF